MLCINIASVLSSNVEHNTMLTLAVVSSFIACAIAKIAYSGLVKQCAKKHCTTELTESERMRILKAIAISLTQGQVVGSDAGQHIKSN